MDPTFRFKISSETDINELILLNNIIMRRINVLQHLQRTPKTLEPEPKKHLKEKTDDSKNTI